MPEMFGALRKFTAWTRLKGGIESRLSNRKNHLTLTPDMYIKQKVCIYVCIDTTHIFVRLFEKAQAARASQNKHRVGHAFSGIPAYLLTFVLGLVL